MLLFFRLVVFCHSNDIFEIPIYADFLVRYNSYLSMHTRWYY